MFPCKQSELDFGVEHKVSVIFRSNETAIGTLNFHNITRQQINKKFYCLPFNHRYMKIEYTFETECAHTNGKACTHNFFMLIINDDIASIQLL